MALRWHHFCDQTLAIPTKKNTLLIVLENKSSSWGPISNLESNIQEGVILDSKLLDQDMNPHPTTFLGTDSSVV